MDIRNKIALVTGAASGIGRASALLFAARGAKLVIDDIDPVGGAETVGLIRRAGGQATFVQADVSDAQAVDRLVATTLQTYGRLDIVHGNAGIFPPLPSLDQIPPEQWRRILDVNLTAQFLLAGAVFPYLRQQRGVLIYTGSRRSYLPLVTNVAYGISKAGLMMLAKTLAELGAKDGVRVNCVCPTGVATNLIRAQTGSTIPVSPSTMSPDDVARVVYHLVTDDSANGQAIAITKESGQLTYAYVTEHQLVPISLRAALEGPPHA